MKTTRDFVLSASHASPDADASLDVATPAAPPGYELIRCLGRGGAGIVHLARDTRLDRLVAVKFLTHAGPAEFERLRREARITARLDNPSIVAVYELGDTEGAPYIAMQYVDGGNLADAELETPALLTIIRDVAAALAHAHSEGIVHRDIKPENILIDSAGRPFLADFGLARSLCGTVGATLSREGQIVGTPGLMPPEQARGEMQAIDARSDVYALGATVYRKLTGRYPFTGENLIDVLHGVIHDSPPLPRSLNADIPRDVEAIIVRAMRKSRDDRYQTMGELAAAIDGVLTASPTVSAATPWFRQLVGQHESAPASVSSDDLSDDPFFTVGLDVVREIASWDANLYRVSGSLGPAFTQLDAIKEKLDGILGERPDTAWARFYRGIVLFRRGRLREAQEDMERAIDRVKDLAGAYFELGRLYLALFLEEHQTARRHLTDLGVAMEVRAARGRLDQAAVMFKEAEQLSGDLPPWHGEYTKAVENLADRDFAGCVAACDRILADDPDVEEAWKLRGDAQRLAGDDPFESYDKALTVRRSYFDALYSKAEAHLERGQLAEARDALQRACEIHPRFAEGAALLARTFLAEERFDEARENVDQALSWDDRSYEAVVTLAETQLGKGLHGCGDGCLTAALETLERARDLEGCQNRVHLMMARTSLERARLAQADGDDGWRAQLESVLADCDEHIQRQPGGDNPWRLLRAEAKAELG